eukprot:GABV01001671.1.p3 GENE.GABV01001671.1~~GABV01001671.1.p3  ORF type:complete len:113 (-),score=13.70 GABV01001671.1:38-376(-)
MLQSALHFIVELTPRLASLMNQYPKFGLTLVGHSLGGATASLAALLWRDNPSLLNLPSVEIAAQRIHAFSFGAPCTVSMDLSASTRDLITSIVVGPDLVGRLSLGSAHFYEI